MCCSRQEVLGLFHGSGARGWGSCIVKQSEGEIEKSSFAEIEMLSGEVPQDYVEEQPAEEMMEDLGTSAKQERSTARWLASCYLLEEYEIILRRTRSTWRSMSRRLPPW